MEGLTLNHLSVARQMTGDVTVGKTGLKVQARGLRPDEGIDVDIKLPTETTPLEEVEATDAELALRKTLANESSGPAVAEEEGVE